MNAITKLTPTESKSGRKETYTPMESKSGRKRNMSECLCDLEWAHVHPYYHVRLWTESSLSTFIPWCIPFDTEVTVSILLYLGQREHHNAYKSINTDATSFGSIQGQYTETGTLHSWAVYRDGIIHDVTENSPSVICFHVSGFSAKAVDTLEWISSIRGLYTEPKYTRPTHYIHWQYTLTVYGDQRTQDFISKGNWLYTGTVYGAGMQDTFCALNNQTFYNTLKTEANMMDMWMYYMWSDNLLIKYTLTLDITMLSSLEDAMHRNIEAIHLTVNHINGLIHLEQAHDEEISTQYIHDSLGP